MIKLCVFDLDGTVANTLTTISYFGNEALKKYGFAPFPEDRYKYFVGAGADALIRNMINAHSGNEIDYENVRTEYLKNYNSNSLYLTKPYDGIVEMLSTLKNMGILCVVLSNKPQIQAENVANALFNGLLNECFGGNEGIPLKPNPTMLNKIIEKYNVKKEECLFIGDTKIDIETAKNADVKSVGVLWGFRNREELTKSGADLVVTHPTEIVDFVKDN